MADCGTLQNQLSDLEQQLALRQAELEDCDVGDVQCIRSKRREIGQIKTQIQIVQGEISICQAIIGTWNIQADIPPYSGQLTITAWDTQGPFVGSLVLSDGSQTVPIYSHFDGTKLMLEVQSAEFTEAEEYNIAVYTGVLVANAQPPQINNGQVTAVYPFATWTAQKQ